MTVATLDSHPFVIQGAFPAGTPTAPVRVSLAEVLLVQRSAEITAADTEQRAADDKAARAAGTGEVLDVSA